MSHALGREQLDSSAPAYCPSLVTHRNGFFYFVLVCWAKHLKALYVLGVMEVKALFFLEEAGEMVPLVLQAVKLIRSKRGNQC